MSKSKVVKYGGCSLLCAVVVEALLSTLALSLSPPSRLSSGAGTARS